MAPFPEETQQRIGSLASFRQGISRLREELPKAISGSGGALRMGQQVIRRVPGIGSQISERISPSNEVVGAIRDRVMADFTRIMSGLQASEQEQARLSRILSDIGTVDTQTALAKIDEFEQAVNVYVEERSRLNPSLGISGGTEFPAAAPTQNLSGRKIRRSKFSALTQEQQQDVLSSGVQVIED